MPKITVLTMCHNYGHFLGDCLASIQAQTYKDFEHIVVNAGSVDDTSSVAQRYPVRLIEIQDLGLSSSRNAGLSQASGEYVVNLDADDLVHPEFLERLVARAHSHALVCPSMVEFGARNRLVVPQWSATYQDLLQGNRIFCCSLFPMEKFEEVGGYDRRLDWLGYEDWALWLKLTKAGCTVDYAWGAVFCYRVHEKSSTGKTAVRNEERMSYLRSKYGVGTTSPVEKSL